MARSGLAPVSTLAEGAAEPADTLVEGSAMPKGYCTKWEPFGVCGMKWASPSATTPINQSLLNERGLPLQVGVPPTLHLMIIIEGS